MIPCRLVSFLGTIIPSAKLRDILLSHHAEICPRCGTHLLSKDGAQVWLFAKEDIEADPGFWPTVKGSIVSEKSKKTVRPMVSVPRSVRWASVTAICISIVSGIWLFRKPSPEGSSPGTDQPIRFRLDSLKVDNKPVNPVVIQPADSGLVIIWVDNTR